MEAVALRITTKVDRERSIAGRLTDRNPSRLPSRFRAARRLRALPLPSRPAIEGFLPPQHRNATHVADKPMTERRAAAPPSGAHAPSPCRPLVQEQPVSTPPPAPGTCNTPRLAP